MGYQEAIEACGVEVYDFEYLGSYQGTWVARTSVGWITGDYGSCSGCDAFEAEFFWGDREKDGYETRLKEFGQRYVDGVYTLSEIKAKFEKNIDWDCEAEEALKWLSKFES